MNDLSSTLARAQFGNLVAYGSIVRRFQDMAVGYAYSFLGDFHLAEDAAQEAFLEAFPSWFRRLLYKHSDRTTRGKRLETVSIED